MRITVDGREVDPRSFGIMPQGDPWPGGHRVVIELEAEPGDFELPAGGGEVTKELSRDFLHTLDMIYLPDSELSNSYLLNLIERIEVVGSKMVFHGIASQVQRSVDKR